MKTEIEIREYLNEIYDSYKNIKYADESLIYWTKVDLLGWVLEDEE